MTTAKKEDEGIINEHKDDRHNTEMAPTTTTSNVTTNKCQCTPEYTTENKDQRVRTRQVSNIRDNVRNKRSTSHNNNIKPNYQSEYPHTSNYTSTKFDSRDCYNNNNNHYYNYNKKYANANEWYKSNSQYQDNNRNNNHRESFYQPMYNNFYDDRNSSVKDNNNYEKGNAFLSNNSNYSSSIKHQSRRETNGTSFRCNYNNTREQNANKKGTFFMHDRKEEQQKQYYDNRVNEQCNIKPNNNNLNKQFVSYNQYKQFNEHNANVHHNYNTSSVNQQRNVTNFDQKVNKEYKYGQNYKFTNTEHLSSNINTAGSNVNYNVNTTRYARRPQSSSIEYTNNNTKDNCQYESVNDNFGSRIKADPDNVHTWQNKDFHALIKAFVENNDSVELTLPPSLTPAQRSLVHRIADGFKLDHKSSGSGAQRALRLTKVVNNDVAALLQRQQLAAQSGQRCKSFAGYQGAQLLKHSFIDDDNVEKVLTVLRDNERVMYMGVKMESNRTNKIIHAVQPGLSAVPQRSTQTREKYEELQRFRHTLPAYQWHDKIVDTVKNNVVTIIAGSTGCGKTTQIPQMLFDAHLFPMDMSIICTQPRRISALSVANRVADERGEACGNTCGYIIRFENVTSAHTQIVYATTGILLRRLHTDPELKGVACVIVDEVHERDVETDFALLLLRDRLLAQRRHPEKYSTQLKVVIMSATIQIDILADYFACCCGHDRVITDDEHICNEQFNKSNSNRIECNCESNVDEQNTQKVPLIEIPGTLFPVEEYYLETAIALTKVQSQTVPAMSLLTLLEKKLDITGENVTLRLPNVQSTHVKLNKHNDEFASTNEMESLKQHEEEEQWEQQYYDKTEQVEVTNMRRETCKENNRVNQNCSKSEETNITIDESNNALTENTEHADVNNMLYEKLRSSVFEANERDPEAMVPYELIVKLIVHLHTTYSDLTGSILVFLPGWSAIQRIAEQLRRTREARQMSICLLHSSLTTAEQQRVFAPPPRRYRKVVLATNIAETSITIDDVVYVIDSGLLKGNTFDSLSNTSALRSTFIGKANGQQRRGRAGRCRAGVCFHLLPQRVYDNLPEHIPPAILRTSLDEVCLQVKAVHPNEKCSNVLRRALSAPPEKSVHHAVNFLIEIGALATNDEDEILTNLGRALAQLPIHPQLGKMLFAAACLGTLNTVATVAAALSIKSPFIKPQPFQKSAFRDSLCRLDENTLSDHLCIVKLFDRWVQDGRSVRFANDHFADVNTLRSLERTRRQLIALVLRSPLVRRMRNAQVETSRYCDNTGLVRLALLWSLYPRIASIEYRINRKRSEPQVVCWDNKFATFGSSSVMTWCKQKDIHDRTFVMYYERMYLEAMLNLFDCTCMSPIDVILCIRQLTVLPLRDIPEPLLRDEESKIGPAVLFDVADLDSTDDYAAMMLDGDKKLFIAPKRIALALKIARECMDYFLALCIKRLRADMFPRSLTEAIAELIGYPVKDVQTTVVLSAITSSSCTKANTMMLDTGDDENAGEDDRLWKIANTNEQRTSYKRELEHVKMTREPANLQRTNSKEGRVCDINDDNNNQDDKNVITNDSDSDEWEPPVIMSIDGEELDTLDTRDDEQADRNVPSFEFTEEEKRRIRAAFGDLAIFRCNGADGIIKAVEAGLTVLDDDCNDDNKENKDNADDADGDEYEDEEDEDDIVAEAGELTIE